MDKAFSSEIKSFVLNNKMFLSGHFKIDKDIKLRDWLDIEMILNNNEIANKICNTIAERVREEAQNRKTLLIGLGQFGLRLVSKIACETGLPFTYAIEHNEHDKFVKHEIEFEIGSDYNIVLITDVIVTGKTLKKLIDELEIKFKITDDLIVSIYTIFKRDISDHCTIAKEKVEKDFATYSGKLRFINDSFDAEACNKEGRCNFQENGRNLCELN